MQHMVPKLTNGSDIRKAGWMSDGNRQKRKRTIVLSISERLTLSLTVLFRTNSVLRPCVYWFQGPYLFVSFFSITNAFWVSSQSFEHFHSELSRRSLCEGLLADLAHFVAFCRFGHRNFRILKIDKQMRSLRSRLRLRSGFHECLRPWWYLFEGCCYMSVSGEYIYNIDIIYIYIYIWVSSVWQAWVDSSHFLVVG